jgi:hypothetical protein
VPERERVLAELRDLEAADADAGSLFREIDGLVEDVRVVRGQALGVESFRSTIPAERERVQEQIRRARDEVTRSQAALRKAKEAVRGAGEAERRAAELFEIRAGDRLSVAERRAAEAEEEAESLEDAVRDAQTLWQRLEADAGSLAEELRNRSGMAADAGAKPGPGLAGVLAWADVAQAALLVARGQVAAERDAVIRQANELGSVALGESLAPASVAVVARRVEQALPR